MAGRRGSYISHITDVKLRVRDIDALAEAAQLCGLDLREQDRFAWWGVFMNDSKSYGELAPSEMGHCSYAMRVPDTDPKNGSIGPWEVGVVKAKDGDGYNLYYDTFGRAGKALTDRVGRMAGHLRQEYAAAVVRRKTSKLMRDGFIASRFDEVLDGHRRVRIRLRRR